ncbi:MAG: thrombospondin type 3 repeat-containing protein [Planctomycetes bacterium]|nr:thrombospondin type 3 repeat-containing protein [Planctomycetota bacterium]MBI3834167.1 thrombospondin type 3 repeat-containing protein [Planctomycetota bacterium]
MDPRQMARAPALSAFLVGLICAGGVAIAKPSSSSAGDHHDPPTKHDDDGHDANSTTSSQAAIAHNGSSLKNDGKAGAQANPSSSHGSDGHGDGITTHDDKSGQSGSPSVDQHESNPSSANQADHHESGVAFGNTAGTPVVLCHKPGGVKGKTMAVEPSAVATHLAHGDTLGPCPGESPGAVPHEPPPKQNTDADSDGVPDSLDLCPGTPAGQTVDANGCSCTQRDADGDGVNDCNDKCTNTPNGEAADENGCSCSQRDADSDGVNDCKDKCANTPMTETADANGCSCSQRDADGDGVNDCNDKCANTPKSEVADSNGCACSQRDADSDGVNDCNDKCANTPMTEAADAFGCSCSQRDADGDGVNDCNDKCANTPMTETADANGCSCSQRDADDDGVNDCADRCANTPSGETADANGCSCSQRDADQDGINDCDDQCSGTPTGEVADAVGCSCSQHDSDDDGVNDCTDACPNTPTTENADTKGCSCSQRDSDDDGVNDCNDECVDTPASEIADATGCSCSQRDADGDGVNDCNDHCAYTPVGEQANATGCSCSQLDGDADGVNDCDDVCPNTTPGEIVDANGCSVPIFTVDAGADRTAIEGDIVTIVAVVHIVQGPFDANDLVYQWVEVGGVIAASVSDDGPTLAVDTMGVVGDATFRLTARTPDGCGSASDDIVVTVYPARFVTLAGGRYHNAALTDNHFIQVWGSNRDGQFGDGSMDQDVESVDAGESFTIVAMSDGTAWMCGQSVLANSPVPVQVPGLNDVVEVSALLDGGILLRGNGTVWGFASADNRFCELAGATAIGATGVAGPKPIPGLPTNIVRIASAEYQTIALGSDGKAWVWGGQRFGCTPFVALDHVVDISAGEDNLCLFVRDDGTAWGMGYNFYGQLGNGNTVSNYRTPTKAVGLTNVVAVAAGNHHSLFLKSDGSLYTAGWNHDCQLGLGSSFGISTSVPQRVGLSNVRMIAGGFDHSVAVVGDQDVYIWGLNNIGQGSGATQTTLGSPVCVPTRVQLASP